MVFERKALRNSLVGDKEEGGNMQSGVFLPRENSMSPKWSRMEERKTGAVGRNGYSFLAGVTLIHSEQNDS